jgi:hypothetical protein
MPPIIRPLQQIPRTITVTYTAISAIKAENISDSIGINTYLDFTNASHGNLTAVEKAPPIRVSKICATRPAARPIRAQTSGHSDAARRYRSVV